MVDNVLNCDSYINVPSPQTYRTCYISLFNKAFVEYVIMNVFIVE
jgi:hypothetical protein